MSAASRRLLRIGIAIAALVLADQVVNLAALRDGRILGRRVAPFDPPLFTAEQEASLERLRGLAAGEPATTLVRFDAELGWTTPANECVADSCFDSLGARRIALDAPDAPSPAPEILLVGCSFTFGDEVMPAETFAHLVERDAGRRVANLGVPAYGIDQALLRLRRVAPRVRPKEIHLGILPKALLRLLSMYRPALRHHEPGVSFKPRFLVGSGGLLSLVPNPATTPAEAVRLLTDSGACFDALLGRDAFVDAFPAAYAPLGTRFVHRSAVARLVLTQRENASRPDVAAEIAEPESELSRVALAIVVAAARHAEELGARFRVLVLPDADDLVATASGNPPLAPLLARLTERGIESLDLAPALLAAGARNDPTWFRPGGHHAPRAHAVVAEQLTGGR